MWSYKSILLKEDGHNELVVFLHGSGARRSGFESLIEAIREARPKADILAPTLPYGGLLGLACCWKAVDIVIRIADDIDRLMYSGKYDRLVLIGHSFGAVMARKVAILAFGEVKGENEKRGEIVKDAAFGPSLARYVDGRPWSDKIERLILIAGMNRGWSPSSAIDWITSVQWGIGSLVGDTLLNGALTIFAIRRGAPFLIQTRLQWLALMRARSPRPDLVVVQLLGTIDDLVAPNDQIDFACDFGSGRKFFMVELPETGHYNAIDMAKPTGAEGTPEQERWRRFTTVVRPETDAAELDRRAVSRVEMAAILPPEPDDKVTDVAFIIHGIRDRGFWTQKIARQINLVTAEFNAVEAQKAAASERSEGEESGKNFRSVTESYGYFAMAPFVLPWVRRQKVSWLMDQYAETRARYPTARFHYVGHSNGTYLAARALQDYPACRFERIVFAGSVVRCDYNWERHFAKKTARVGAVLNYVATSDFVVAIFPKGMQPLRAFDLGAAGHDGFSYAGAPGQITQMRYIRGGHGAGIQESQWDDIARFVVTGETPPKAYGSNSLFKPARSRSAVIAGRISSGLLVVLLAFLVSVGVLLLKSTWGSGCALPGDNSWQMWTSWLQPSCWAFPKPPAEVWDAAKRAFWFVAYCGAVALFINRY